MTIQAPGRPLFVVRSLRSDEEMEALTCRDENRADGRLYTLLIFKQPQKVYDAISILMEIKNKGVSPDFVDCFSLDSRFHALFLHHEPMPLMPRIDARQLILMERLEAANGLFQQILMQDYPPSVLMECLEEENLYFDASLEVSFGYDLKKAEDYRAVELGHAMTRVSELLDRILGKDKTRIINEQGDTAQPIIDQLAAQGYAQWSEAYAQFRVWYDVVKRQAELEEERREGWIAKFWRFIARLWGIAKPVLAIALIAASIGYLVYSIMNPPLPSGAAPGQIQVVGDIVLPTPEPEESAKPADP